MKSEVLCVSNRLAKETYYIYPKFLASLRRFGVEPTVLGWNQPWHGLMTKPRKFREHLRAGKANADILIVCDAWDIVFAAHPDEIVDTYYKFNTPVVFNAERNCFPRGDLADQFPDKGTPWRFLNSGFMVGPPSSILDLLESMNLDAIPDDHKLPDGSWFNPNDQEHFTLAFLKQPVRMALDYNADLCMTGHGTTVEQLQFSDIHHGPEPCSEVHTGPPCRIKQTITGTYPMAFHFNGDAKNVLQPAVLKHMGL